MTLVRRTPDDQRRYIVDKLAALDMDRIASYASSPSDAGAREWATLLGLWSSAVMLVEEQKGKEVEANAD